jgi:hypothetical protein
VIVKTKTSKKVVQIFPKVSTGRSLNSCIDCKISISVMCEETPSEIDRLSSPRLLEGTKIWSVAPFAFAAALHLSG